MYLSTHFIQANHTHSILTPRRYQSACPIPCSASATSALDLTSVRNVALGMRTTQKPKMAANNLILISLSAMRSYSWELGARNMTGNWHCLGLMDWNRLFETSEEHLGELEKSDAD